MDTLAEVCKVVVDSHKRQCARIKALSDRIEKLEQAAYGDDTQREFMRTELKKMRDWQVETMHSFQERLVTGRKTVWSKDGHVQEDTYQYGFRE